MIAKVTLGYTRLTYNNLQRVALIYVNLSKLKIIYN